MNELILFIMALGLLDPWQVVDIRFSQEEGRLDLKIDFPKGAKFLCPSLHALVPRVKCGHPGIKQVETPWVFGKHKRQLYKNAKKRMN